MKRVVMVFLLAIFGMTSAMYSQKSVDIDGRLQPILDEFFKVCDKYDIDYHEKLLGMVTRDANGDVENILINWAAMLDPAILKVVAFHEFAHHFLDYKHTCQECNEIMAVINTSYFDIANDWDNQVENLFTTSPVYLAKEPKGPIVSLSLE